MQKITIKFFIINLMEINLMEINQFVHGIMSPTEPGPQSLDSPLRTVPYITANHLACFNIHG